MQLATPTVTGSVTVSLRLVIRLTQTEKL